MLTSTTTAVYDKEKAPLFKFAWLGQIEDVLNKLKKMAMDEVWEYSNTSNPKPLPILYSYLLHTFTRLQEEKKVIELPNCACFNTGLITDHQQEIYAYFRKGVKGYAFQDFFTESHHLLAKYSSLPERASFFEEPSDLLFDPRLDLRINIDHIIGDPNNYTRFPPHIQTLSKHQLINTFNGAIEHAKKRIKRNYKTAIPQYYRGPSFPKGQLQLLLPLCLTDPSKADLALTVYKEKSFYAGRTCLTLDMAINNARLIAKPDDEWLKA